MRIELHDAVHSNKGQQISPAYINGMILLGQFYTLVMKCHADEQDLSSKYLLCRFFFNDHMQIAETTSLQDLVKQL